MKSTADGMRGRRRDEGADPGPGAPGRALVTGASSGIGEALARALAARGWALVLTARSAPRLEALARELRGGGTEVEVVVAELADPGAPRLLEEATEGRGRSVDLLVNNAGFGYAGAFLEQDPDSIREMAQVNLASAMELSRRFGAAMARRGHGGILQVASTAAFQPGPLMAVYYATKAGLLSFSEALREELRPAGVTVTCLCPGVTRSGFHARAGMDAETLLDRVPWHTPKAVAEAGLRGLERGKARVVPGLFNQLLAVGVRLLPRSVVPPLVLRVQRYRMRPPESPPAEG